MSVDHPHDQPIQSTLGKKSSTSQVMKRPQYAPPDARDRWPGITYPDEHGLQVRVSLNGVRHSKYFAYSEFEGDVMAAHNAAANWRMREKAGRQFKLRGRGPHERKQRRRADGVIEHAIICRAQCPDGKPIEVKFYIGTENTVTDARQRRAQLRAEMWWGQYRRWYEDGGRHPMEAK